MIYWTLFLILSSEDMSPVDQYFALYSFKERSSCEASILKKEIIKDKDITGKLVCLKTDEFVDIKKDS